MRQLLPELVDDADPEAVHASLPREAPEDRPFVLVNMIESIDGAAVVDGASGGLGGEGDKIMFRAVRAVPDIILVAARTANAERYSAPRVSEASRDARRERGQSATPRLAVVTGQLSVDLSLEMFTDPGDQRPLVITAEAAPTNRRDEVEAVAEILVAGETNVDLTDALRQLRRRGASVVLGEGGPSVNGGLVGLDLVVVHQPLPDPGRRRLPPDRQLRAARSAPSGPRTGLRARRHALPPVPPALRDA